MPPQPKKQLQVVQFYGLNLNYYNDGLAAIQVVSFTSNPRYVVHTDVLRFEGRPRGLEHACRLLEAAAAVVVSRETGDPIQLSLDRHWPEELPF